MTFFLLHCMNAFCRTRASTRRRRRRYNVYPTNTYYNAKYGKKKGSKKRRFLYLSGGWTLHEFYFYFTFFFPLLPGLPSFAFSHILFAQQRSRMLFFLRKNVKYCRKSIRPGYLREYIYSVRVVYSSFRFHNTFYNEKKKKNTIKKNQE